MEDLHLTVHHRAHWEWVRGDGGIGEDEETRPIHALAPEVVLVKRLIPGDSATDILIPGDTLERMANERAAAEGSPETHRRHLHDIVAIHVRDTLHHAHAPAHAWHKIETHDEMLQKSLHARFIKSDEEQV